MKLLLDEKLSRRLVRQLDDLFPDFSHVYFEDLFQAPGKRIWEHVKHYGFAIVTADSGFYELATAHGHPPKVIWLRGCGYPTAQTEELIRSQAIRIVDFLNDAERAVLILQP